MRHEWLEATNEVYPEVRREAMRWIMVMGIPATVLSGRCGRHAAVGTTSAMREVRSCLQPRIGGVEEQPHGLLPFPMLRKSAIRASVIPPVVPDRFPEDRSIRRSLRGW